MTDTQPAGVDLARAALAAARAAAKTRPTQPQKKTTRTRRITRTGGRDPLVLGSAITGMMTERGWEPPESGGSILDQWPTIAPELADKVHAERFEHDTGTLHLRPMSDAYATQLRMFQAPILAKVQQAPSGSSVRALKILPVGGRPEPAREMPEEPSAAAAQPAPPPAPAPMPDGYRQARALLHEHKLRPSSANPYEEEARQRQIVALRANRLPDSEDREAMWVQAAAEAAAGPTPGSMEASERAALAYKRRAQAGLTEPRRTFDVA